MDGRNCSGRRISLLNDSGDVAADSKSHVAFAKPQYHQLPPFNHHQHHSHLQHLSQHQTSHSQSHPSHLAHILAPPASLSRQHSSASTCTTSTSTSLSLSHSRNSSASPSPSLSPLTPPLSRSYSSDSRAYSTPSPLTPSYPGSSFDLHAKSTSLHQSSVASAHYHRSAASSAKMDHLSNYPPVPDASNAILSAYPMSLPNQMMQPAPHMSQQPMPPSMPMQSSSLGSSASPSSEPSLVSNQSNASNAKSQPKKNQYPCPMAKQFNCPDFFTTSGHAARHAKKHTGKKDAFCPECNKAFTRKDNMEQHRRTHQNGRGTARTSTASVNEDSKVKKATKAKSSVKVEAPAQLEAAIEQQLAEQIPLPLIDTSRLPLMPSTTAPLTSLPPSLLDQTLTMSPLNGGGPYYISGSAMDAIPVSSLPMAVSIEMTGLPRPQLQRSSYGLNNLDYVAPMASMVGEDALHYSYPSPGLSNGLNSLALAASEHRRLSEEKSSQSPPAESQEEHESAGQETPTEPGL